MGSQRLSRRSTIWIAVIAALLAAIGVGLAAMPSVIQWAAARQLTALTGLETTIDDVDVSWFPWRIVAHDVVVEGAEGETRLAAIPRVELALRFRPLLRGRIAVERLALEAPRIEVVRHETGQSTIDTLLAQLAPGEGEGRLIAVEHFSIADGALVLHDAAVEPDRTWRAADVDVEVRDVDAEEAARGTGSATLTLAGAAVSVSLDRLGLRPMRGHATLTTDGLELGRMWAYVPDDAPVRPRGGRLTGRLEAAYGPDGLRATGESTLAGVTVLRPGQAEPLVTEDLLSVGFRDLVVRDHMVRVGRLEVRGSPVVIDASREPAQRFPLDPLRLVADDLGYPISQPGQVVLEAGLPDGGRLAARGSARLAPLALDLDVTLREIGLAFARPYMPPDAPVTVAEGRLHATLDVTVASDAVQVDGVFGTAQMVLTRRGQAEAFVRHPRLDGRVTALVWRPDGGLTIERLRVAGTPTITDATASPPVRADFAALSLVAEDVRWPAPSPARVRLEAQLADGGRATVQGRFTPATLAADVEARFEGADLRRAAAYLPPDAPVGVAGGSASGEATLTHGPDGRSRIDGTATVSDLALALSGQAEPLVTAPRLQIAVQALTLEDEQVGARRLALEGSVAVDPPGERAEPVTVPMVRLAIEDLGWPALGPARLELGADLPERGRLRATGGVALDSRRLDLTVHAEDAALGPFARLAPLRGPVHGRADVDLEVEGSLAAPLAVTASGKATVEELTIGEPGETPITVAQIAVDGLTARWPLAVSLDRVILVEPSVLIVREEDFTFPLRAMLTPAGDGAGDAGDAAGPGVDAAKADDGFPIRIGRLEIEGGDARFIDRTVTPPYSEELTNLALTVEGLDSRSDDPARVTVQAVVGADAALELAGQIVPFADPLHVELDGELRGFALPRTNPYVTHFTDWVLQRGSLTTQLHYRIVGDRLNATNELLVQRLRLERERRGAEADRKLGIPLGLVAALLADHRGDIRVTVPVSGELGSPQFSFGDAIATAFRQLVSKLVTGPFQAIGRIFRRDADGLPEAMEIDPLQFAPGVAVVPEEGRKHLQRVADFLRAHPQVDLRLRSVASAADVRALRGQEALAAIQQAQRAEGGDFETAATRVFERTFPHRPLPDSVDGVVTALAEEARPVEGEARALARRRLATVRELMVEEAGIQPERLRVSEAEVPPGAPGDPRVEFDFAPLGFQG